MRRVDDIGFGGYKLIQDSDLYCYGTDAVLLSKFCNAYHKDNVLDLCTGNGVIPLIINALYNPKQITGIELQKASFLLAVENAKENKLDEKIKFINGDVNDIKNLIVAESFDLVTMNPPYFEAGNSIDCDNDSMHIARHETTADLSCFIKAAGFALKSSGRLCMVHRPSRLPDIFETLRENKLEPKRLQMIAPKSGEGANIMLVEAVKGARKELKILPEIILH